MSKAASKALKKMVMEEIAGLQELPAVSMQELAKHNKPDDAWVMVDGVVYDVTKFARMHPGGKALLLRSAGTDATADFKQVHADSVLKRYARLRVGRLAVEEMDPAEAGKLLKAKAMEKWLPLSEPYFNDIRGTLKSPHIKPKHLAYQAKLRAFLEKEVVPFASKWDEARKYPLDLHKKAYAGGVYSPMSPPQYGGTPPEGGWDFFMGLIHSYEMSYLMPSGLWAGLGSKEIALPPILAHGSEELKRTVGEPIVRGEKIAALAITEPWGGSDVAAVRTTAVRDGDFYIVTGEKKFITSGTTAHFLTTAVRTDPTKKGMDGVSLLVIPTDLPGVVRTKIENQGWWCANTALINLESVRVPVGNLIGEENKGFGYIMSNFNTERFSLAMNCVGGCQMMIRECIKYARNRRTFGQPLIKSQVIRHKIAAMAMKTEALFALAEQITYQMHMKAPHIDIGPRIALAKVLATQTLEFCAREASQIFGGNSYMRAGPGQVVERHYREVRVAAIGGGSEEIMLDLAMRGSKL